LAWLKFHGDFFQDFSKNNWIFTMSPQMIITIIESRDFSLPCLIFQTSCFFIAALSGAFFEALA